jgi:hypothetical protein
MKDVSDLKQVSQLGLHNFQLVFVAQTPQAYPCSHTYVLLCYIELGGRLHTPPVYDYRAKQYTSMILQMRRVKLVNS